LKHFPDHCFALKAIGLFGCFGLNVFRDGKDTSTFYGFLSMVTYHMVFNAQGMLDSFYWQKQLTNFRNQRSSVYTVVILNSVAPFIAWTMPTVSNDGFLFFYPLYTAKWLQNSFVMGAFFWVYLYSLLT
jgi:hypothetical protein